jgi:hypothetical protein
VAVAASTYIAGLMQRDWILVSLGSAAVEFLEVLAGQEPVRNLTGEGDRYSGKVQQHGSTMSLSASQKLAPGRAELLA